MIFVAINYRLGAFGWLAGTSLEADGTANAGLYDQALAFRWVRDHIHLFGGDASRITAIGKSSGAGSLMHQVTSFGGDTSTADHIPAFQHAIITSPAFLPQANASRSEQTLQQFLALLNVTTLAAARTLPTEALIRANALQIYASTYGSNSFGPAVDTAIAPALPGQLLLEGRFHRNLTLAVSHNANEALTFTDPRINSTTSYAAFLHAAFPDISAAAAAHVEDALYPPVFDGSRGYATGFQRAVRTVADAAFACNAFYLASAFANASYAWEFAVPPGIHGQDTSYIFPAATGGSGALLGLNRTVAVALREYIASFAAGGVPVAAGGVEIPVYGAGNRIVNLTDAGIGVVRDDTANERCVWWQKGEYVGTVVGGGPNVSSSNGTSGGSGSDHASGSEKTRPWQVVIAILVVIPLGLIW
ncbi:alpha/beta-hydrolase [Neofusicoccum parvum]|nr:alpha/beta-hydrolase [Neofusicoccum parvum]